MYAPMSLYTMRTPGSVSSGVENMSLARLSGSCVISSYALNAGNPDVCVSRWRTVTRSLFGPVHVGDVALQRRVEIDAMLLDQLHHRRGQPDDLRERRQVPERVVIRPRRGCPIELADAIFGEDAVVRSDDGERAREGAVGARAVQDVFDAVLKGRTQGRRSRWGRCRLRVS